MDPLEGIPSTLQDFHGMKDAAPGVTDEVYSPKRHDL